MDTFPEVTTLSSNFKFEGQRDTPVTDSIAERTASNFERPKSSLSDSNATGGLLDYKDNTGRL